MVIFLVCFTNIFWLTKFYSNEDRAEEDELEQGWGYYLLYTYYIFFAAWESPSPITKDLQWIWGMWALVTLVFTVVMFNVLIAVIESSYKNLVMDDPKVETMEKLEMILEICQFRI